MDITGAWLRLVDPPPIWVRLMPLTEVAPATVLVDGGSYRAAVDYNSATLTRLIRGRDYSMHRVASFVHFCRESREVEDRKLYGRGLDPMERSYSARGVRLPAAEGARFLHFTFGQLRASGPGWQTRRSAWYCQLRDFTLGPES